MGAHCHSPLSHAVYLHCCVLGAFLQVSNLSALLEAKRLQSCFTEERLQSVISEERLRLERLRTMRDDALMQR